ncbi:MAG: hypothetical protein ACI8QS_000581 [Planctomycetota bacterium]|jgi:hypothetical protein
MRISNRLFLALPLLAAAPLAFSAQSQETQSQDTAGPTQEEHEEGPLEQAMSSMQRGMRALGRSMRTPEGAGQALRAVDSVRTGLTAALACEPHFPAEMTDEVEQKLFVVAFRRKLTSTLDATLELQEALLGGKAERATELFGILRAAKDAGHEAFISEEDDH